MAGDKFRKEGQRALFIVVLSVFGLGIFTGFSEVFKISIFALLLIYLVEVAIYEDFLFFVREVGTGKIHYFLPERVYKEDLGDFLERMEEWKEWPPWRRRRAIAWGVACLLVNGAREHAAILISRLSSRRK